MFALSSAEKSLRNLFVRRFVKKKKKVKEKHKKNGVLIISFIVSGKRVLQNILNAMFSCTQRDINKKTSKKVLLTFFFFNVYKFHLG